MGDLESRSGILWVAMAVALALVVAVLVLALRWLRPRAILFTRASVPASQVNKGAKAGKSPLSTAHRAIRYELEGEAASRRLMHRVLPVYPDWALEKGIMGQVKIVFSIRPEGTIRSTVRFDQTSGFPDLDEVALEALRQWRFSPSTSAEELSHVSAITFTFRPSTN